MTFEQFQTQKAPSRASRKLMQVYEKTRWPFDQGQTDISTSYPFAQIGKRAVPFNLSLGRDVLPIVLADLNDLQIGEFHNIDQEDVLSVLEFPGHLFMGSVSLNITCENFADQAGSAALSLSETLGMSRAFSFICFLDYFHELSHARQVINSLSACSPAESYRIFGLRTSGGMAGIYRFTVLGIAPEP